MPATLGDRDDRADGGARGSRQRGRLLERVGDGSFAGRGLGGGAVLDVKADAVQGGRPGRDRAVDRGRETGKVPQAGDDPVAELVAPEAGWTAVPVVDEGLEGEPQGLQVAVGDSRLAERGDDRGHGAGGIGLGGRGGGPGSRDAEVELDDVGRDGDAAGPGDGDRVGCGGLSRAVHGTRSPGPRLTCHPRRGFRGEDEAGEVDVADLAGWWFARIVAGRGWLVLVSRSGRRR